jgi:hypothetical protein
MFLINDMEAFADKEKFLVKGSIILYQKTFPMQRFHLTYPDFWFKRKMLLKILEGDSADTCTGKFPLLFMGGRAVGLACAGPGARTPICASGNFPF